MLGIDDTSICSYEKCVYNMGSIQDKRGTLIAYRCVCVECGFGSPICSLIYFIIDLVLKDLNFVPL